MNRSRFQIQAACVLALVALVQWPQFRSVRAVTIVGPSRSLAQDAALTGAGQWTDGTQPQIGIVEIGYGSLSGQAPDDDKGFGALRVGGGEDSRRAFRASPLAAFGARWNALTCLARTAVHQPVPYARVVLRDAASGRLEARATADREGRCTFVDVAPGAYVLDVVGGDGAAIASSGPVAVNDGAVREATVVLSPDATAGTPGNVQSGALNAVNRAAEAGVQGIAQPIATNSPQQ